MFVLFPENEMPLFNLNNIRTCLSKKQHVKLNVDIKKKTFYKTTFISNKTLCIYVGRYLLCERKRERERERRERVKERERERIERVKERERER